MRPRAFGSTALKVDVTIRDQPLNLCARVVAEQGDQYPVQAMPIEFGGEDEVAALGDWLLAFVSRFPAHAAARLRRGISCGLSGVVLASHVSMIRLSGARTREMNCDVENPSSSPRGSPR